MSFFTNTGNASNTVSATDDQLQQPVASADGSSNDGSMSSMRSSRRLRPLRR
jgi:hypothetical protein